jgi:hypothetical protein
MAIPGIQVINVGLPNESANSDSIRNAFNKTVTNFNTLFDNASPYNTYTGNTGISVAANATSGTVDITNTGVTNIIAGTNIVVSQANGNVTISATGGGGGSGGTVTSVGIVPGSTSRLTVSNSPVVSAGNMTIDLATSGAIAGSYVYPAITVDSYGRVTNIANGASVGTVTSVGITPGAGIQVTGTNPITTSGTLTVVNTGVTSLSAGTGIMLSGSNGNVTISTSTSGGTVTSIVLSSSTLTVTGSPITSAGTITVDLPSTITLSGNITGGNLKTAGIVSATGNISGGNLLSSGGILSNNSSGIGYATGSGGTVTQLTSRTTGVTINKISGAITLFSAAGTSSYTTFTVTNSTVAATDVIIVNQKSGTDKYEAFVTNVSSGSFDITFSDTSGTTTEQPVFNFAVIKAVAA